MQFYQHAFKFAISIIQASNTAYCTTAHMHDCLRSSFPDGYLLPYSILQYPGNGFTCYIVITDHSMVEVEQLIWCACLFLDSNLTFKRYLAWWTLVLPKFEGHSSRHEKNER